MSQHEDRSDEQRVEDLPREIANEALRDGEVVYELPLTVTGKVQKGRLRGIERRRLDGLL